MSKQYVLQNNFSHGEIDPKVYNVSLDIYYKAAKYVRNLYIRPQGGAIRRHGSIYQSTIPSSINKMGGFIHDTENAYILVWYNLKLAIYKETDGISIVTTIDSPYLEKDISAIKFAQVGQTLYSTHPSYPPKVLTRTTDSSWKYIDIVFKNAPTNDFDNSYTDKTFTLSSADVGDNVTLTASGATFSTAYIGGIFLSIGDTNNPNGALGLARITGYTSPTVMTVNVINKFDASSTGPLPQGLKGTTCDLAEPAYSATRGYPATVGTSQSRLCFGGGTQTPNIISMSKINSPLNFNVLDGADLDAALMYTMPGKNHNSIEWIMSNQSVQIFGTADTFSTTSSLLDSQSLSFSLQTDKGASNKCSPQTIDNEVYYVRKGGKAVMQHVFNPQSGTYASSNKSLMASDLIRDPVSSAVLGGDTINDADYLFLVNSDGTLAVLQALAEQNVLGWSLCGTGDDLHNLSTMTPNHGLYKNIVSLNEQIYVIVERLINGSRKTYIEKLSFTVNTDSTIVKEYSEKTTLIEGLETLEAIKVKVWADGYLLDDQTVTNGQITIEMPATSVSVGMNYNVQLTPLPVNIIGSHTKYLPKRIVRLWVDYYDSIGIDVNGTPIPELKWSNPILGKTTKPRSGTYTARGEGWNPQVTFDITQQEPLPFLITGIGYEVEI